MLEESKHVRQHPGEPPRRWFADEDIDLIVWSNAEGFFGFQLCYNKQTNEHALAWNKQKGFQHFKVDGGEPGPLKNLSPLMVADGPLNVVWLSEEFQQRSQEIDPAVRDFVLEKLAEFPSRQ